MRIQVKAGVWQREGACLLEGRRLPSETTLRGAWTATQRSALVGAEVGRRAAQPRAPREVDRPVARGVEGLRPIERG